MRGSAGEAAKPCAAAEGGVVLVGAAQIDRAVDARHMACAGVLPHPVGAGGALAAVIGEPEVVGGECIHRKGGVRKIRVGVDHGVEIPGFELGGGLGHTFTIVMFTQKFVDETGYTSLEEVIADRYPIKLITKKNGSLGELTAERVIEACGSSVEDFLSFATWEKTGTDAIKSGLQDDLYDMTIDHIDAGQATTTEICLTHDMYFVQLGDEALANMQTMGYAPIVMEAGTWNGQDTDINSMGSQQNVLVPASMDEELAYALTKAMCENKDEMAQAVASLGYFDPQTAGSAEMCGAPLHPGAIRYYEENGYPYDA